MASEKCPKDSGNCELTTDLDDEVDDKYFNSFLFWRTPLPQIEFGVGNSDRTQSEDDKVSSASDSGSSEKESCSNEAQGCEEVPQNPKLEFCHGDDDSDEEETIPLYSLTGNLDGPHSDRHVNSYHDYDDRYRNFKLQSSSSFEEDLLISEQHSALLQQVCTDVCSSGSICVKVGIFCCTQNN